jgi:signal peptidase II
VAVVIVLDILTKRLAETMLPLHRGVPVLGDFFQLQLVYNPGAAFGLHVGGWSRWFFTALTLVALGVLVAMVRGTKSGDSLRLYALASVIAGASGNLVDRQRSSRGVVDFLLFSVGDFRWPNFNVADMAVSCGAVALALALWNEGRHEHAAAPTEAGPPGRP